MIQLFLGILLLAIAAVCTWFGGRLATDGWKTWQEASSEKTKDVFAVNFMPHAFFKWPGPMVFVYPSGLGKQTISPVSIALYVEVVNKRPTISRIYSYSGKALLKYDEGGQFEVIPMPNGNKFKYNPTGKVVENWRKLHSMGYVDQVYFIPTDDWTKSKRIDFSQNSFEMQARTKQLNPGESVSGWMFFDLEADLRGQVPEIKEWEFTITNSAGESQVFRSILKAQGDEAISFISAGSWNLLGGYFDLSKEGTIVPYVDLPELLKKKSQGK